MNFKGKKKLVNIISKFHLCIFGYTMSDKMIVFLHGLSWSFFGGVISAGIIFIVQVFAARWLGPEQFGKYTLVSSIATFFAMFMKFGLDIATLRYISFSTDNIQKIFFYRNLIKITMFTIFFMGTGISVLAYFFCSHCFVSYRLLVFATVLSMFLVIKDNIDIFVRAFNFFKLQAFYRFLEAITVLLIFIVLLKLFEMNDFKALIIASIFGIVVIFMLAYNKIINIVYNTKSTSFYNKINKKIYQYARYALLGAFTSTLMWSGDKIVIGKYLGEFQLGVYNAYFILSIAIVMQLSALFINVFFPTVSRYKNKKRILYKINKIYILLMPLGVAVFIIILLGGRYIYGQEYFINLTLIYLFSFVSVIQIYFTILWWLIASQGVEGIRFTSLNGIVMGLFFISTIFFFRSELTVMSVLLSLLLSLLYGVVIGNLYIFRRIVFVIDNKYG